MRNGTYYVLESNNYVSGRYKADEFDGDEDAAEWAKQHGGRLIREDYRNGKQIKETIIYEDEK